MAYLVKYMKRTVILLLVLGLILSACASKNQLTGKTIQKENPTKAGVPITGSFAVDKGMCVVVNAASVSSVLNRQCKVDSDCYGVAKAVGVTDMSTVKCS